MAEKGIDKLFEVMLHLASDGINCELNLLGFYEENYREKLRNMKQKVASLSWISKRCEAIY